MGKVLSRTDFLAKYSNRRMELVDVPELGGSVYLQELSTAQLLEYNMLVLEYENKQIPPTALARIVAKMIVFSACDADRCPMFTDADIDALAMVDINNLMSLRKRIVEISGLGEVAADLKKAQTDSSATG
jgi:hypothetical protein